MKTNELENIKGLIQRAEVEKAKSQGVKESIKSEWKKKYGFETIGEAEEKLSELESEYNKNEKKKEKYFNELSESQDWEKIEEDLEG
jgi:hypothetical protein